MILTANGTAISCTKAVKGTDYIKLYDSGGNCTATFSGISDFSGYSYTDDSGTAASYSSPDITDVEKLQNDIANISIIMLLYDAYMGGSTS